MPRRKMIALLFVACATLGGALARPEGIIVEPYAPFSDGLIDYVNTVQKEWRAGQFERFARMPLETVKGMMGAKRGNMDLPTKVYPADAKQVLPENFDGRQQWPHCPSLRDIRDQSTCGSCWAFGSVEAMSDRLCISGVAMVNISAENLLSCCEDCGAGCDGGYPQAAYSYFHNTGIVTGGQYNSSSGCQTYSLPHCDHHSTGQYKPCSHTLSPTPTCSHSCRSGYSKSYTVDLHHGGRPYSFSNTHDIMVDIMTHGSVTAAFTVFADFPAYKSGVYHHVHGSMLGGHAIKIIGWGVEGGVDYWLVANSWNSDWGDNGYFKIRRGVNECGIEESVVAATMN